MMPCFLKQRKCSFRLLFRMKYWYRRLSVIYKIKTLATRCIHSVVCVFIWLDSRPQAILYVRTKLQNNSPICHEINFVYPFSNGICSIHEMHWLMDRNLICIDYKTGWKAPNFGKTFTKKAKPCCIPKRSKINRQYTSSQHKKREG